MATLGQAYVQIIPSADGISGQISNVLNGPADTAGKTAGNKFGAGFGGNVKKGLIAAGVGVTALGAAAGAALTKSIGDAAEYGDRVDKLSQKIGFSAEGFQKWDYVLQRAGTSIDSMAPVMKKLSTAAVENSDAFQKLGISQEEVANMSQEDLFGRTIEALSGMEAGAERTALASKLLGKGASELTPLINGGTDAIREQMDMASQYGMVMSDEAVKASADFHDAQTTLQGAMSGFKNKLAAEFMPAITDVTNGIAKMFSGDMSGLDDIKNGISEFVSNIGSHVPDMITKGGELLSGFISGIAEKIPELATSAAEALSEFADNFGSDSEGGSTLLSKAADLMAKLGKALIQAAGVIFPALVRTIWTVITRTDWMGLGRTVMTKLFNAMKNVLSKLVTYIGQVVKNIATKLGFPGLVAKVSTLFNNVRDKITEPINRAKEIVDGAIERIKGLFPISIGNIFSNVRLPHFSVSGGEAPWGFMGRGSLPSVSIDWYAKAMNEPYLFNRASLIGVGEKGDEMVYGRSALLRDIKEATSGGNTININVTVTGAEQPEAYAQRLVRELELQLRTA